MCPLSNAINQSAYAAMQPSSPPQPHPLRKPTVMNDYSGVFTVRRENTALSTYLFWLMSSDAQSIIMWCEFLWDPQRIQHYRSRDSFNIKAIIQAHVFAVDRAAAADRALWWCAAQILFCTRYVAHEHIKQTENVAAPTSKTKWT
jgi:hypothetical protein